MRSTILRTALAGLALAAPLLVHGAPAYAAGAVGVVTGSGSIDPGVPAVGCVNNAVVDFSGTGVVVGDLPAGPYAVSFHANSDTCEDVEHGHGTGALSGDVFGTVEYTRTLGLITLSGTVTVGSATRTLAAADCEVVPTSAQPVTTYQVHCVVVI